MHNLLLILVRCIIKDTIEKTLEFASTKQCCSGSKTEMGTPNIAGIEIENGDPRLDTSI